MNYKKKFIGASLILIILPFIALLPVSAEPDYKITIAAYGIYAHYNHDLGGDGEFYIHIRVKRGGDWDSWVIGSERKLATGEDWCFSSGCEQTLISAENLNSGDSIQFKLTEKDLWHNTILLTAEIPITSTQDTTYNSHEDNDNNKCEAKIHVTVVDY